MVNVSIDRGILDSAIFLIKKLPTTQYLAKLGIWHSQKPWRQQPPDSNDAAQSNVIPEHEVIGLGTQVHLLVHPLSHRKTAVVSPP